MATVTVSSSTTYDVLSYATDDNIVISGAATLTCNVDPTAQAAPRSIRSSSSRATFKVRNSATTFTSGNLWKLSFTNPGSAMGANNATLGFASGATLDVEGEWLECYTATGTASETVLDASNVLGVDIDFPYFIEAETAPSSGVWRAVPVGVLGTPGNGYLTTVAQSAFGTGDVGRVLFYDHSTRLLKTGDGTNGSLFTSGTKFRIPNIYLHLPAFTLSVATGGWTTATGAQNVTSSTNAPILAAGNLNYTGGSECFNISATPSGTTVTVNNRASDGTTATAFTAGTVLYALPASVATLAGKISCATNGYLSFKRCFVSRWMVLVTPFAGAWYMEDVGACANQSSITISSAVGPVTLTRGVIYGGPSRGAQATLNCGSQLGSLYIDGLLNVVQASASSTASYTSAVNFVTISNAYTAKKLSNIRAWRLGLTTGMNTFAQSLNLAGSTPADTGVVDNLELVGTGAAIAGSDFDVPGIRFSATNGSLITATTTPFTVGGSASSNIKLYDFDLLSGGVAPYGDWFNLGTPGSKIKIHNKVSGTPRSIDCQGRSTMLIANFNGSENLLAAIYLTNLRGTDQTLVNGFNGVGNTVRDIKTDSSVVFNVQPGMKIDFPPGPVSAATGGAAVDSPTFYAAPNTWTSYAGGLYLSIVSRQFIYDAYVLGGNAYTNNTGNFYLETSGDSVWFKSTNRVTGISSITGSAVVYVAHNNITTGVTAEFRLCNWGDDISAVSWASFTGSDVQTAFNALTNYMPYIGLDFQLRFTATSSVAGRYINRCYVPAQLDATYNPAVGFVDVTALGATDGALMALYDGADVRQGSVTIVSGTGTIPGPHDFDGSGTDYRLKIRELESQSIDITSTYSEVGALVPAQMAPLSGYVTGPYADASFNKATKEVTITAAMTTQDLWSAWREYIVQLTNFDVDDTWSYPALIAPDWTITTSGAGSISGAFTDVNGAYVSASISNIVNGSRILIQRTDTNAVLANAIVSGTTYGYTVQTATTIPIRVVLRKASASPFYQEWSTTGSIEPVGGFAATANQIPD